MRTLVVIPAFNEGKTVASVIRDLKDHGFRDIVVIDDGSSDNTSSESLKAGVVVLKHIVNRGLGAGIGTGFEYAKNNGFELLITFDGDGQHVATDLGRLIGPIIKNKADVVIGSRLADSSQMPFVRKFLNWSANALTFALFGVWTTDSQSGLRAFNKKAINCIKIKTDRMEVSSEFFKEIARNHLRFVEIPIKAIYTDGSIKGSKQGSWASVRITLKLIIRMFR
jgi:glycosyltransferase involved in cell wall biosynthesis